MRYRTASLFAALLITACSTMPPQIEYRPLHCPPVPACRAPAATIRTNADLAHALLSTRSALAACTIARDTLQACIDSQPQSRP